MARSPTAVSFVLEEPVYSVIADAAKQRVALILAMVVVSACAIQPVQTTSSDSVTLERDTLFTSQDDVRLKATRLCGQYGKKAVQHGPEYSTGPLFTRATTFHCVAQ
jgi:hypothetical protein